MIKNIMSPVNPKFKNKIIIARWKGYVDHIENETFTIIITPVSLKKKKKSTHINRCYVEMNKHDLGDDVNKLQLGVMLDWYVGYEKKPHMQRPVPFSKIVFWKKYGLRGQRINMQEVERKVSKFCQNITWE